jgi:hypothetical protein
LKDVVRPIVTKNASKLHKFSDLPALFNVKFHFLFLIFLSSFKIFSDYLFSTIIIRNIDAIYFVHLEHAA